MQVRADDTPNVSRQSFGLVAAAVLLPGVAKEDFAESDFDRAYRPLLRYLGAHLLQGPVDDLRDRIGSILRDDEYHRLMVQVEATVPMVAVQAMFDDEATEGPSTSNVAVPPELEERLRQALRIQLELIRMIVAAMPTPHPGAKRRRSRAAHVKQPPVTADARLWFMQEPLPVVLKRALLGGMIAPICSFGLLASTTASVDTAVLAALLEEWISNMQHLLALGVATGEVTAPSEYILPSSLRFDISQVWGKYLEGVGRTIQRMANLPVPPESMEPSEKP